jgi:glutamate dehydrogenase (NAD(P)+)
LSRLIGVTIDEGIKFQGYLAIDSTVNGRCHGGVRISPDTTPDLIAQVARAMTLKYGFIGLPVGGAKAGIVADPEIPPESKRALLRSFGQAIEPFLKTRSYIPATDLGTSENDVRFMLSSIGLRPQPRALTYQLSGFYTGITCFAAAISAASHIGLDLSRVSAAIEGFGSVGASVAQAFWEKGIRVVAISTSQGAIYNRKGLDVGELIKLRDLVGSQVVNLFPEGEKIDRSQLAGLDVDIFSPCAQSYSITSGNAERVAARIISPGANVPTTLEAEQVLFQRGIICIPDFVANCGGVLGSSMKRTGLREDYIRRFLEDRIGQQALEIIEAADKQNIALGIYAQKIAEERFIRARASAESKTIRGRAFKFALEMYRKGIIPYQLVTPAAPRYFDKRFR